MACLRPYCAFLLLISSCLDEVLCTTLSDEPMGTEALRALRGELREDTKIIHAKNVVDKEMKSEEQGLDAETVTVGKENIALEDELAEAHKKAAELKRISEKAASKKGLDKEQKVTAQQSPKGTPAGLFKLVNDAGVELKPAVEETTTVTTTTTMAAVHMSNFWKKNVDKIEAEMANATHARNATKNETALPKGSYGHLKDTTDDIIEDQTQKAVVDKKAEYKNSVLAFQAKRAQIMANHQAKAKASPRIAKTAANAQQRWLDHWASLHPRRPSASKLGA